MSFNWDVALDASHLMTVFTGIVGVFGGAGFWAWRTEKTRSDADVEKARLGKLSEIHLAEEARLSVDSRTESEYRSELSRQVSSLLEQLKELNEDRGALLREIRELKQQLRDSNDEVHALKKLVGMLISGLPNAERGGGVS